MRVLIDTTYAERAPHTGTAIYIRELIVALEQTGEVEVLTAANLRRPPPAGGGLGSLRNLASDARWLGLELPGHVRRVRAHLVHHPLPALARTSVPQALTVADLAFERLSDCFDPRFRLYAHLTHRWAARRAAGVICVSHTTADDARELWGVPAQRIVVAPHGPGQRLPGGRPVDQPTHFLYVGDAEPRKNLDRLLAAYARYRERAAGPLGLVLAGSASAVGAGVRVEPGPSPERLAELYAGSAAVVQPSLYEGFGLTVLEAMSAGIPVLAARSPGLLEVGAEAVLWADPRDVDSLAQGLERLAGEPALRAELAHRGQARAAEFSWAACARAHLSAYSLALGRAPAQSTP